MIPRLRPFLGPLARIATNPHCPATKRFMPSFHKLSFCPSATSSSTGGSLLSSSSSDPQWLVAEGEEDLSLTSSSLSAFREARPFPVPSTAATTDVLTEARMFKMPTLSESFSPPSVYSCRPFVASSSSSPSSLDMACTWSSKAFQGDADAAALPRRLKVSAA